MKTQDNKDTSRSKEKFYGLGFVFFAFQWVIAGVVDWCRSASRKTFSSG